MPKEPITTTGDRYTHRAETILVDPRDAGCIQKTVAVLQTQLWTNGESVLEVVKRLIERQRSYRDLAELKQALAAITEALEDYEGIIYSQGPGWRRLKKAIEKVIGEKQT